MYTVFLKTYYHIFKRATTPLLETYVVSSILYPPQSKASLSSKLCQHQQIQSHTTNDANSHHPISLHSVFSKIIEKLMVVRLTTYLELHDLDIQLPIPHRRSNQENFG